MAGEVFRVAEVHHCDFRPDLVEGAIVLQLYYPAGVVFPLFFAAIVGEEYLAHGPFAEFLLEDELLSGILIDKHDVLDHLFELVGGEEFHFDLALQK